MDRNSIHYLLGFLGILLVFYSIAYTPPTLHYISALEDWNYMREFSLHTDGKPHVYVVPLPADANFWAHVKPDCSDVRVTVGAGASERLLDSVVLDCNAEENAGRVAFFYDGSNTRFRLYYGNGDAVVPPTDINIDYVMRPFYRAPPFSEDDYIIRYCDDDWHGNLRFYSSRVYLTKWDDDCASAVLGYELPDYTSIRMRLKGGGWGDATVDIFFSSDNNVEPDYEPEDAVQLRVVDDGRIHVVVLRNGNIVNEDTVGRNSYFWLSFYPDDGQFRVYVGNSYLGTIPGGRYLTFVVEKGDSRIELKDLVVEYPTYVVRSVHYTPELMAPKSPRIEGISLGDGEYYNDGNLTLSFRLVDPNNDVELLRVYLDDNLLDEVNSPITPYTYTRDLDLNDGTYTVKIHAVDSESASTTQTLTFTVDTKPPILDVNSVELNGNELNFHIYAYDPNLLGCHYFFNNDQNVYDIPCEGNISIEWNGCGTVHVYAEDKAHNVTSVGIDKPCPVHRASPRVCNCTVKVEFSGSVSPEQNAPEVIKSTVQPASSTVVGSPGIWTVLVLFVFIGVLLGLGL